METDISIVCTGLMVRVFRKPKRFATVGLTGNVLLIEVNMELQKYFPTMSLFEYAQIGLATKLLQETAQNGKSVVLSPLSVSTALFAMYLGANGTTKQQFTKLGFVKLLATINKRGSKNYTLRVANRLYVRHDEKSERSIKESFKEKLRFYFVEKLCSVSYSKKEEFVQMSMMEKTDVFPYHEDHSVQVIKLPYIGGSDKLEMVIILPIIRFGLPNILKNLTAINLLNYVNNPSPKRVTIRLPKFQAKGKLNLKKSLKKIGIANMFDENANFGELTDAPISVDEKGTQSGAQYRNLEDHIAKKRTRFIADQPFLFVIVKNITTVLFAGQYVT
uniref:Serpin domain-containing protein n=1 Tax=Setaria digitata TaxID=48799 RepID=A0A915PHZ8_9BILA